MTTITSSNISSTTSQPKGIADVQRAPNAYSNMLSFLTDQEKQNAELISKKWQNGQKQNAVENGYGDFILINTNGTAPKSSVYREIFPLLSDHLPQVHQQPLSNRLQTVNQLIQKNFSEHNVKAVFIPRTLYELCFLLSGCEEELERAIKMDPCGKRDCYHGIIFEGSNPDENRYGATVSIAARLNRFIIKTLHVSPLPD